MVKNNKNTPGRFKKIRGQYRLVTERPIAVLMIAMAIIVFGYFSYNKLSLNLMPDISYPTLTIRTEFEGSAPEEVENLISRPLEQTLAVVRNKTELSSISRAGQSDIIIEFTWDTDMNTATQDVRELIEQFIPPEGAKKPLVLRYDPTLDPIMRYGIYPEGESTRKELFLIREISEEDIKRDLEAIPGVAAVKIKGGLEEEISIDLFEKELTNIGLDINRINTRLASENVNLAGGNLEEGDTEYMVRTLNLFINIMEIENLIVATKNGAEIRLKDIGRVYKGNKKREVITKVNGKESVELEIYKEADANIVQLAERVRNRVFGTPAERAQLRAYLQSLEKKDKPEEKKPSEQTSSGNNRGGRGKRLSKPDYVQSILPDNVKIALLSDQSTFIKKSIDEVKSTAIFGGIFAIAVLFFFLRNGYSTFIIALSIPISVVATFAPMNLFTVSLNMMSLGGLALGIGMLVDNSIVVLESIFRCREEGDGVIESAVRGAAEVGGAVTASTLTTISVFLPIVFVEGVAGQLFGDLSLTVVFSLIMSLIVALFFIPMLASRNFKKMGSAGSLTSKLLKSASHEWIKKQMPSWDKDASGSSMAKPDSFSTALKISMKRMWLGAVGICYTILETFGKFALLFLSGIWVFFKFILIPIFFILMLIWKIITGIRRKKFRLWDAILSYTQGNYVLVRDSACNPFRLPHILKTKYVWDDLLVFSAWNNFGESFKSFWSSLYRKMRSKEKRYIRTYLILAAVLSGIFVIINILSTKMAVLTVSLPVSIIPKIFMSILGGVIAGVLVTAGLAAFTLVFVIIFYLFSFALNYISQLFLKLMLLFLIGIILFGHNLVNLFIYFIRGILSLFLFGFDQLYNLIKNSYPPILKASIRNSKAVITGVFALLIITFVLILPNIGSELIPEVHQGEFNVEMRMPVGTPLLSTADSISPMEEFISGLSGIGIRAAVIGAEKTAMTGSDEGEHTAKITVRLDSKGNLIEKEEALIEMIRDKAKTIAQVEANISRPALFSFKTPIEVEIRGYNLLKLKDLSKQVVKKMSAIEGLYDVRSNIQPGNPEIQITYDRELLAKHNLDISMVAQRIRNKVLGYVPTRFNKEDRKIEIRVKVAESDRDTIEELKKLNISPSSEVPLPLSAIAELKLEEGPAEIRRIEQQRAAIITANVSGLDLASAATSILHELSDLDVPADFNLDISGQNKEMEVSMRSLMMAMLLAIFLVYTVMAMLFESIIQPFMIILSIPLALIGVIVVLWIGNISLSVVVGIGAIVLVGIVVNNAIVLVDYTNTLRKRGYSLIDSVVEAGKIRLRPILMTTATTVLGLLPMALGLGEGAEIRTPMAWTIIAGLLSSTLLTLLIIPTAYMAVEEMLEKRKLKKLKS